jgi:hypothetical protein
MIEPREGTHVKVQISVALLALMCCGLARAGDRAGGLYNVAYESLNGAGISYATNGAMKLGGSLGQSGLMLITTNTGLRSDNGFWKAEVPCELYPATVTNFARATNNVAITFPVMLSNTYSVAYLNVEGGGLTNGLQVWTNIVAGPVVGAGGVGSVTTLFINVSSVTNKGRFFIVRCQ